MEEREPFAGREYRVPQTSTIDFTQLGVAEYLDGCIDKWRKIRDSLPYAVECFGKDDPAHVAEMRKAATYYIDAFQSMRVSLFGNLKP